jgi:hypothetical protein
MMYLLLLYYVLLSLFTLCLYLKQLSGSVSFSEIVLDIMKRKYRLPLSQARFWIGKEFSY